MVSPPSQNTERVCNQIILFILYYIRSRLVNPRKVTDAPTQVSDILGLTVSFKFYNFSHQIFLLLFFKYLLASRLTLFRLSILLWLESCTHCILACFLWSKYCEHLSPNRGLSCFHSYKHRLSSAEILIVSFMFCQALFKSWISFQVLQICKPIWDLNMILFHNLQLI